MFHINAYPRVMVDGKYDKNEMNVLKPLERHTPNESKVSPSLLEGVIKYPDIEIDLPEDVLLFCMMVETIRGKALVVGGAVRDALLNRIHSERFTPRDYDIEVFGLSFFDLYTLAIKSFGKDAIISMKPQSKKKDYNVHCLKIVVKNENQDFSIDITVARQFSEDFTEIETSGTTLLLASGRRGTGPEALYYDPSGECIYDPTDSASQLFTREVSAVHPLFRNDITRLFRAVKHALTRGLYPDKSMVAALKDMVNSADKSVLREKISSLRLEAKEQGFCEKQILKWEILLIEIGLEEYISRD